MFENINALIFDMDGTLIDSMGVWKEIDIEYFARFGMELPDDLQKQIEGLCFHDTAVYFHDVFKIPRGIEDMKNDWNEMALYKYTHNVLVKPGVLRLLSFAKERGMKLAIATSNSRLLTDAFLKSKGLYDTFDYVLTGCETYKSKPDPEIYLAVSDYLNVLPQNCLVFEDIVAGIMAGKNAGMKVVGVDDNYSKYCESEKKNLSDYYLYSYNDIVYSE